MRHIPRPRRSTLPLTLLLTLGVTFISLPASATDKEDFDTTKISACHDDAKAQYRLGLMYSNGTGTRKDLDQAALWYRKAAAQNNAEAEYQLGSMYDSGQGLPQSFSEALSWYKKAAAQGHQTAQANIATIERHLSDLQGEAERGEAKAQVQLGTLYATGNGVPQDNERAMTWYRKAAGQGNSEAEYRLGLGYAEGKGAGQDNKEAVSWYRKAAEQGNAQAAYALAGMYHKGQGVSRSAVEAYAWLSLAAAQGYQAAIQNKDFAASKLTPEEQQQAQALAAKLQFTIGDKKP